METVIARKVADDTKKSHTSLIFLISNAAWGTNDEKLRDAWPF